ncbi:MAG: DMT family transporter, partial [Pseudohongiellaceae bacterium]
ETGKAWLQIHFCVFLWGFTAILGKLITLPALPLVLWRMLMVAALLWLMPRVWRGIYKLSRRYCLAFCGVGLLVALHWLTFYSSIKLANASVAATCMAMLPMFSCVIEPLVTGRRFIPRELLLAILILPGIALVVGGTPDEMNLGIVVGAFSALIAATFGAYNKRLVHRTDSLTATALEMSGGGLFVLLIAILYWMLGSGGAADAAFLPLPEDTFAVPDLTNLVWIATLAVACTLVPFALSFKALRHLSAYATALAVNMEPIYAIILAMFLLGEQRELGATFYLGAAIILLVVFVYPFVSKPRVTPVPT